MKYIGIDLGGTNVRVGKFDEDFNLIKVISNDSYGEVGPKAIEDNIFKLLEEFDLTDVQGIGFGIPGPVNRENNCISFAGNLKDCVNYPFAANIEKAFGKKVILENDANVAGLAEAVMGAGKDYKNVFYLTHSTGIGGAFIINGNIYSGKYGYGGEIGNMIVDRNAYQYPYYEKLNRGAIESLSSGIALSLFGKDMVDEKVKEGKDVFDLAANKDKKALALVDDMAKNIAICLSNITSVIAPDCFVIGGGCSKSSDLYFDLIRKYYQESVHALLKDTPILKAKIKEPGLLGSAILASKI